MKLTKEERECDYVWTPPDSDGWKLMQNARKIDLIGTPDANI